MLLGIICRASSRHAKALCVGAFSKAGFQRLPHLSSLPENGSMVFNLGKLAITYPSCPGETHVLCHSASEMWDSELTVESCNEESE